MTEIFATPAWIAFPLGSLEDLLDFEPETQARIIQAVLDKFQRGIDSNMAFDNDERENRRAVRCYNAIVTEAQRHLSKSMDKNDKQAARRHGASVRDKYAAENPAADSTQLEAVYNCAYNGTIAQRKKARSDAGPTSTGQGPAETAAITQEEIQAYCQSIGADFQKAMDYWKDFLALANEGGPCKAYIRVDGLHAAGKI